MDIFDKNLGKKFNLGESPHKKKIESLKVNMNELQNFCIGDKLQKEETEEKKKYRLLK